MSSPDEQPRSDADDAPEAGAPRPHAGGFTLDLSTGKPQVPEAWRRQRKKADPLTTKIIDLTQPKAKPAPEPQSAPKPEKPRKSVEAKAPGKPKPSNKPKRASGGATLADLLDPETLARLRGK